MNPRQEFEDALSRRRWTELRARGPSAADAPAARDRSRFERLSRACRASVSHRSHARGPRRSASRLGRLAAAARTSRGLRAHRSAPRRVFRRRSGVAVRLADTRRTSDCCRRSCRPDDLIVSDERNHASLIDGIRLTKASTSVYPHQDLHALETALRAAAQRARDRRHRERVQHGWRSDAASRRVARSPSARGAALIVDEAHATGLYGARGSGRVEELGLRDRVLATIHTGGKALGSGGAWVAGSRALRDVLVNRARSFIFSTAPLPVLAAALGAGLELVATRAAAAREVHRKSALAEAGARASRAFTPAASRRLCRSSRARTRRRSRCSRA